MDRKLITVDSIRSIFSKKGYKFFENDERNYNINIFGVRTSDMTPNTFNDYVCIMWKFQGKWYTKIYDATTDPGLYYILKPMNVNGTAIMVPDQYINTYEIGIHKTYKALVQKAPMKYYRDNNRDKIYDMDSSHIYTEIAATNIHHASFTGKSNTVDNWSAGCQVLADIVDWNEFIDICDKSKSTFGNSFSYTLLTEKDFTASL